MTLHIEIFSDIICPWCFIGKRRLDRVLATTLGEDTQIRWRPYLLYPNLPADGVDRRELLKRRYGENADASRIPSQIKTEAESEGLTLRFDQISRTPNTMDAHRLMEFAFPQGVQHELAERLFNAYFIEGLDVGDKQTLVEQGCEVGLDKQATEDYLYSEMGRDEVEKQLSRAPELGVSGVPGYYLADSFLLPGAQTAEVMGQILTRVKERLVN